MRWLVTGGVGFIGTNLVDFLRSEGDEVVLVDDLSREGVKANKDFLTQKWGQAVIEIDVADEVALMGVFRQHGPFDAVAHLAGQVSLMASIENPRRDFLVNALGTLNVLEATRALSPEALVIGMSSNKVYGGLSHVKVIEEPQRYVAPDFPKGFDESQPLDFHGPYGCSKGTADQYLLDYHRIYQMKTVSLRQSSVYGPFQHPRSDQGWVGYLLAEVQAGREIHLHGVGKQVRDLLHASDFAKLIQIMARNPEKVAGQAFNVGGGPANAMSILELFEWLERYAGLSVKYSTGALRPSDQPIFIADISRVSGATGWHPTVSKDEGLKALLK
jgi:CDP-paratose 2-epimerase